MEIEVKFGSRIQETISRELEDQFGYTERT